MVTEIKHNYNPGGCGHGIQCVYVACGIRVKTGQMPPGFGRLVPLSHGAAKMILKALEMRTRGGHKRPLMSVLIVLHSISLLLVQSLLFI